MPAARIVRDEASSAEFGSAIAAIIDTTTPRSLGATATASCSHDTRASSSELDVSSLPAFAVSSSKLVAKQGLEQRLSRREMTVQRAEPDAICRDGESDADKHDEGDPAARVRWP